MKRIILSFFAAASLAAQRAHATESQPVVLVSYDGEQPDCRAYIEAAAVEAAKQALEEGQQSRKQHRTPVRSSPKDFGSLESTKGLEDSKLLEYLASLRPVEDGEGPYTSLPAAPIHDKATVLTKSKVAAVQLMANVGTIRKNVEIPPADLRNVLSPLIVWKHFGQRVLGQAKGKGKKRDSSSPHFLLDVQSRDVKFYSQDNSTIVEEATDTPVGTVTSKWLKFVGVEKFECESHDDAEKLMTEALENPCVAVAEIDQHYPIMMPGESDSLKNGKNSRKFLSSETRSPAAPPLTRRRAGPAGNLPEKVRPGSEAAAHAAAFAKKDPQPIKTRKVHPSLERLRSSLERSTSSSLERCYVAVIWGDEQIPNDPYWAQQWEMSEIDLAYGWELRSERGRMFGAIESEFPVAVLDTGIEMTHTDLKNRLWKNPGEICDNGIDDDENGYIDDCHGFNFYASDANLTEHAVHGTPASGAVVAEANNDFGVASICSSCSVMMARIGYTGLSTSAFAEGLNYAMGWEVKVVNYSGNGPKSMIQQTAIKNMAKHDAVITVCAGNQACDIDKTPACKKGYGFPANLSFDYLMAVGASDKKSGPAVYSNFGKESVDIFAPSDVLLPYTHNSIHVLEGTSFAAPFVAGVAALIRSTFPSLNANETVDSIVNSCWRGKEFEGLSKCEGVIDVPAALSAAGQKAAAKIGAGSF